MARPDRCGFWEPWKDAIACVFAAVSLLLVTVSLPANAQGEAGGTPSELTESAPSEAPGKIEVTPLARDEEIARRLQRILNATDWFRNPQVRVEEGVAFLSGSTRDEQFKKWAGDLARNTRDVVAVVNRIDVEPPSVWNFQPALNALRELVRDSVAVLPLLGFSILILLFFGMISILGARFIRPFLRRHIPVPLLRQVISRTMGILLLLLGLYLILRISGLSRLALSVLGGTGLIGLVIGIAFRDITENFLASVLLSIQRPFRPGDLVELTGNLGYVQQLNVRTTILMTLDGNHVQIPNSTVYKSIIRNFTSNPNRREEFVIGIGFESQIDRAQEVALQVLAEHPAVLKNPEPWVLVDNLGPATVNLKIYFWLDGSRHSWLKVRSSVIRLVKRAFQRQEISMPDAAREVVFPRAVPVHIIRGAGPTPIETGAKALPGEEGAVTKAEAGLDTESEQIREQARRARIPEQSEDLLSTTE